jgi:acetyltransferase
VPTGPQPGDPLPEDYPSDLEQILELDDGTVLRMRPVLPSDAQHLGEETERADAETLYMRFFTPKVHFDEARLRYLTELDYHHRLAVVVFVDDSGEEGEGVAIARYEGKPGSDRAEVAVTVKPRWRNAGLGKRLVRILEAAALQRGITTFEAMYLGNNEGAAGLMQATGFSIERVDSGVVTVTKLLQNADAG